jgi:hypothetical protein
MTICTSGLRVEEYRLLAVLELWGSMCNGCDACWRATCLPFQEKKAADAREKTEERKAELKAEQEQLMRRLEELEEERRSKQALVGAVQARATFNAGIHDFR